MRSIFKHSSQILCAFWLLLFAIPSFAQDIHFSQFYASPLNLNPALTGKVNGGFRVAGIYRNQWNSVSSPFVTPAVSFDAPFVVGKAKKDAIGGGILLVADNSNGGAYSTIGVMLSGAYHLGLGKDNKHQLSLGLQGGFVQKRFDASQLIFGNQIRDGEVDPNQTGEILAENDIRYGNFNTGIFYNGAITNKLTFYTGGSFFNLFTPQERFTTAESNDLPIRVVVHGGLDWAISEKVSLIPGVLYMSQAAARQINFGTNVGFHLNREPKKELSLYLGGWYRWDDAAIAMVAAEYRKVRLGISYDFTTSTLRNASNGSFEISLIYIGNWGSPSDKNVFLFCPRY